MDLLSRHCRNIRRIVHNAQSYNSYNIGRILHENVTNMAGIDKIVEIIVQELTLFN
jgi:hypothetical protein